MLSQSKSLSLSRPSLRLLGALVGEDDSLRCLGLVASFFAPVFALILNLGSRYLLSHWRLFVAGWLPPGAWTVAIDCVGQQQRVWRFPQTFLTGVATLPPDSSGVGLLKLDFAAVWISPWSISCLCRCRLVRGALFP